MILKVIYLIESSLVNQMYLTYIQIVSLEILPNYQCIKGPTIESIVVPLFLLKSIIQCS